MPSVLITGASRGIGRATALDLAAAGWQVYAGVRNLADGKALFTLWPNITPVELDVTDRAHLARLDEVLPPRLDALVNNAGIVVGGPVEAVRPDDLRKQLDVNVVGQIALTQAVLPRLRAARGRVVFLSSVSGRVSTPMTGAYSASKYAIEALADSMRVELRPWRVRVLLVEPGPIDTDMWRGALDTIDQTEAAMAPEHRALYGRHVAGLRTAAKLIQRRTAPVEKVVAAVESALTDRFPRPRYVVGIDARVQLLARAVVPTRVLDLALARLSGWK